MNVKKHQLENYKRFLLTRASSNNIFVEFLENCLVSEDEAASYCFHKVMIHNWSSDIDTLYDTLMVHFDTTFIPINCSTHGDITIFYTSSLQLIIKILRFDFMFPFQRSMFNINILFYDKSAEELLDNHVKIDDIVAGVVSKRFSDKQELDLSNFSNDSDFQEKHIHFYKCTLLSYFKILMIRIGRDTKELNMSNNNLSQPPLEIFNFFIKGDLIAVNLSNNNIVSISDLTRVSSKIEKLWLEGNPLCESMEPTTYVKSLITKFPRLRQLDGVELNTIMLPFVKNYVPPNKMVKMVLEKFLTLYFSHYDSPKRKNITNFYDPNATLSITTKFNDGMEVYYNQTPKLLPDPSSFPTHNMYVTVDAIHKALSKLPMTVHDPTSFTVDVLFSDTRTLVVVIDGLFKEIQPRNQSPKYYQFRRTFVFKINKNNFHTTYHIVNELYQITNATDDQIRSSFEFPVRNLNSLALINPDNEEMDSFIKIFMNITQLKRDEAEARLILHNWVLIEALENFVRDLKLDRIPEQKFVDEDDFSDLSSIIEDEID